MVPNLERHCGSWVIVNALGKAVAEVYERRNAEKADAAGYEVVSAATWLARVNYEVRHAR